MHNSRMSIPKNTDVQVSVRSISSASATELYINVIPGNSYKTADEALSTVYAAVATELRNNNNAQILSERLIASETAFRYVDSVRKYLPDNTATEPVTILSTATGKTRIVSGVQVHAVVCDSQIKPIVFEGEPVGRSLTINDRTWIHLAAITGNVSESPREQTETVFRRAAAVLKSLDMSFRDVARTWVWIRDILSWYDDFNSARTGIYKEVGLVANDGTAIYLPASTGIGVAPEFDKFAVGLELIAVSDGNKTIHSHVSSGEQQSAFTYGSAFARASIAPTPAGTTLFISGTAAIDNAGNTEHKGDAGKQINATFSHVRAILNEAGMNDRNVMSAIVYCKTPEIAALYQHARSVIWSGKSWPCVETIADICRDDLLFEIELTAAVNRSLNELP